MRIIGGHDYYDGALAFGHDPSVVLVREKDKVLDSDTAKRLGLYHRYLSTPYSRNMTLWGTVAVVVADKLYMGATVREIGKDAHYAWSQEAWADLLAQFDRAAPRMGLTRWSRRWLLKYPDEDPTKFFEPMPVPAPVRHYMIDNRISILLSDHVSGRPEKGWLINPDCLKESGFAKCIDPYTLFQELDMWVSGVLGMPANAMVEVSNDTKIHKHGFDKGSFRKPKSR
jgi:hypothetical protein